MSLPKLKFYYKKSIFLVKFELGREPKCTNILIKTKQRPRCVKDIKLFSSPCFLSILGAGCEQLFAPRMDENMAMSPDLCPLASSTKNQPINKMTLLDVSFYCLSEIISLFYPPPPIFVWFLTRIVPWSSIFLTQMYFSFVVSTYALSPSV